jgi:hypothetical protein
VLVEFANVTSAPVRNALVLDVRSYTASNRLLDPREVCFEDTMLSMKRELVLSKEITSMTG